MSKRTFNVLIEKKSETPTCFAMSTAAIAKSKSGAIIEAQLLAA